METVAFDLKINTSLKKCLPIYPCSSSTCRTCPASMTSPQTLCSPRRLTHSRSMPTPSPSSPQTTWTRCPPCGTSTLVPPTHQHRASSRSAGRNTHTHTQLPEAATYCCHSSSLHLNIYAALGQCHILLYSGTFFILSSM